jgi:hypothetical protein
VCEVCSIPEAICKISVDLGCALRRTDREWVDNIMVMASMYIVYVIMKPLNTMSSNVV